MASPLGRGDAFVPQNQVDELWSIRTIATESGDMASWLSGYRGQVRCELQRADVCFILNLVLD